MMDELAAAVLLVEEIEVTAAKAEREVEEAEDAGTR